MKKLRTLKEGNFKNKKVIVRVDFNVSLKNGIVQDDTRVKSVLPTLKYLIDKGARLILISHLGRPKDRPNPELSLKPVATCLSKLLKKNIHHIHDCIGKDAFSASKKMKKGDILMLENIRFYKEEQTCDEQFSKKLASLGDVFVNDAFGVMHRKHASTYGIAKYLPSYAGLLVEKEIEMLSSLLKDIERPFTMIFGGAKIKDKIGVITSFLGKTDYILVGGGIANTFLAAQGFDIGASLYEPEMIDAAQEIMLNSEKYKGEFIVPCDALVADEISEKADTADIPVEDVIGDMRILDIGKLTIEKYCNIIKKSKTVVWNGPMGLFEVKPFAKGSVAIAKAVISSKAKSYVGGGDTLDLLRGFKINEKKITHVSTGGGAMLEFLEGKELPALTVLYS